MDIKTKNVVRVACFTGSQLPVNQRIVINAGNQSKITPHSQDKRSRTMVSVQTGSQVNATAETLFLVGQKPARIVAALCLSLFLAMMICVGGSATANAQETKVLGARLGVYPDYTRFVIDLDRSVEFSYFLLPDPYRVIIDMPEIEWTAPPGKVTSGGGLISGLRYGLFKPGTFRVVLDVAEPALVSKIFTLPASDGKPHRLVVDLSPAKRDAFMAASRESMVAYSARSRNDTSATEQSADVAVESGRGGSEKPLIAIDAGHGGVDPGAIGVGGVYEKDLTLAAAREVEKVLTDSGRYRVLLTRDKDVFLKLRQRTEIARKNGADLFISLHADSIGNSKHRGASVYTLSENASDKEAAALASKENKADVIAGIDLSEENSLVQSILIDLAQRETMNLSATLAANMVTELGKSIELQRRTHRFAGFAVLKAPDIPSALFEMGYLSNATDAKLLQSPAHRRKVAEAILRAIDIYFEKHKF
ncbi:N-acetylmuramoyl-L-alanine amidase [Thalassospira sp. 11-3]|jgi:N-acetylmuramoyl-L-alanine amidase|nr:cell wall hydrolase/autolysin [Thalassospira sp. KO164]PXX32040.1 N-acetylmuramoyl-L-alanine amidase [Thalassospira sp. 11-3]SEE74158.1 N-acetylmuramoyl-L-alanine amidase [Thalassospira permensis]|tara:strand:- start:4070 stop:5503 length:1434 start_codon:yes stop_codon:yes gene_type:complete